MLLFALFLLVQATSESESVVSSNWWGILGLVLLAFLATWIRRKVR